MIRHFVMKSNYRRGISLLDIMAIITMVGILSVVLIPKWVDNHGAEHVAIDKQNKSAINAAIERWYIQHGEWPQADLSDIGTDPEYFPIGLPKNPLDGSSYTLDPKTHWAR